MKTLITKALNELIPTTRYQIGGGVVTISFDEAEARLVLQKFANEAVSRANRKLLRELKKGAGTNQNQ